MGKFVKIRLFKRLCGLKKSSGSASYAHASHTPCHMLESSLTTSYLGLNADKDLEECCLASPSPPQDTEVWSLVDAVETTSKATSISQADLMTARGVSLDTTTCTADTQSLLAILTPSTRARRTPHGRGKHSTPAPVDKTASQYRRRYARQALKARREYGRRLQMRTLAYV